MKASAPATLRDDATAAAKKEAEVLPAFVGPAIVGPANVYFSAALSSACVIDEYAPPYFICPGLLM